MDYFILSKIELIAHTRYHFNKSQIILKAIK